MTDWHTNLIKGYVLSPARRRAIYLGMVSYFALCGLALVAIAYQATVRMVHTVHERSKIRHLEENFRTLHEVPEESLTEMAHRLEQQLKQTHGQLETTGSMIEGQINLTKVLAGVSMPLPRNVRLVRLDLVRSRGVIQFDVVMPNSPADGLSHAQSLVDTWNRRPKLKTELSDIRILTRQTQRVNDQSVVVLRLEGRLTRAKKE